MFTKPSVSVNDISFILRILILPPRLFLDFFPSFFAWFHSKSQTQEVLSHVGAPEHAAAAAHLNSRVAVEAV